MVLRCWARKPAAMHSQGQSSTSRELTSSTSWPRLNSRLRVASRSQGIPCAWCMSSATFTSSSMCSQSSPVGKPALSASLAAPAGSALPPALSCTIRFYILRFARCFVISLQLTVTQPSVKQLARMGCPSPDDRSKECTRGVYAHVQHAYSARFCCYHDFCFD